MTLKMFDGTVTAPGAGLSVKMAGDMLAVSGVLVAFTSADQADLVGDFFSEATYFGPHKSTPIYYNHGFDTHFRRAILGEGELSVKDAGIWIEGQVRISDEYLEMVAQLAKSGRLGWSSGTAMHLVDTTDYGSRRHVDRWPLGLDASLTPEPCMPYVTAVGAKSVVVDEPVQKEDDERPVELGVTPMMLEYLTV